MKNTVFWDTAPCRYYVKRRFGGKYRLHLQRIKIRVRGTRVSSQCAATCSRWFLARGFLSSEDGGHIFLIYPLKMEAILSSETSVYTISTRRYIPENGILQILVNFPATDFWIIRTALLQLFHAETERDEHGEVNGHIACIVSLHPKER
jgi:hypothetical protein